MEEQHVHLLLQAVNTTSAHRLNTHAWGCLCEQSDLIPSLTGSSSVYREAVAKRSREPGNRSFYCWKSPKGKGWRFKHLNAVYGSSFGRTPTVFRVQQKIHSCYAVCLKRLVCTTPSCGCTKILEQFWLCINVQYLSTMRTKPLNTYFILLHLCYMYYIFTDWNDSDQLFWNRKLTPVRGGKKLLLGVAIQG